jgi:hypothetical protein
VKAETLARLPKSTDLEIHVRLLDLGDRQILEFVDHVPSLNQFGRGFWIPLKDPSDLLAVAEAIRAAAGGSQAPG